MGLMLRVPTDCNGTGRERSSRPVALSGLMARPLKQCGGGRVAAHPDKRVCRGPDAGRP